MDEPDDNDELETRYGRPIVLLDPARAQVYTVVVAALLIAIFACISYFVFDFVAPTGSDQSPSPARPGFKDVTRPPTAAEPGADAGKPIDTNDIAAEAARRAAALSDRDPPVSSLSSPIPLPRPRPKATSASGPFTGR